MGNNNICSCSDNDENIENLTEAKYPLKFSKDKYFQLNNDKITKLNKNIIFNNKDNRDDKSNEKYKIVLKPLNQISQNQLITRSDFIKEKFNKKNKYSNYKEEDINQFIPINYEIIPEKINNDMFDQGDNGICYLIAGINAFNEIPSIFDQLFIDKKYSPYKSEYSFNVFINSNKKIVSLNNKFLYYNLKNNKLKYKGNQPFKYELFLKFIVKLYAELNSSKKSFYLNEIRAALDKLQNIEGGWASEIYSCILGTSSLMYSYNDGKNEYINKIEEYINIPGNILATSAHKDKDTPGHQYAVKNMIEYFGNGEKKKFITLYNPWGKGNIENEFFDFNKIKEETKNFDYITKYNNEYRNTGLIKIPLNLFGIWFSYLEICCPKYGFHYKVFNNYIEGNLRHIYCFSNHIKQLFEIELFLDQLDNIRKIDYEENNFIDVELILSEIKIKYNNCCNNNTIETYN